MEPVVRDPQPVQVASLSLDSTLEYWIDKEDTLECAFNAVSVVDAVVQTLQLPLVCLLESALRGFSQRLRPLRTFFRYSRRLLPVSPRPISPIGRLHPSGPFKRPRLCLLRRPGHAPDPSSRMSRLKDPSNITQGVLHWFCSSVCTHKTKQTRPAMGPQRPHHPCAAA